MEYSACLRNKARPLHPSSAPCRPPALPATVGVLPLIHPVWVQGLAVKNALAPPPNCHCFSPSPTWARGGVPGCF